MPTLDALCPWLLRRYDSDWGSISNALDALCSAGPWGTAASRVVQKRVNAQDPKDGHPFAALIPRGQPESGPYGGMSFVLFPSRESSPVFGLVIGSQGLQPDEGILSRPGHARATAAIARHLNELVGDVVAWAKRDPIRTDVPMPASVASRLAQTPDIRRTLDHYGKLTYLACSLPQPCARHAEAALATMLGFLFTERNVTPLTAHRSYFERVRSDWIRLTTESVSEGGLTELLQKRRFVILEGPPGTGKTRLARRVLAHRYAGRGMSIQFHPSVTYEDFVGGLSPMTSAAETTLRFAPKPGHLLRACEAACREPNRPFLLHIDEINRSDLAKTLGEAIYLFEAGEPDREIELPYDFGGSIGRRLRIPENLHVLGTMNNADRNIAIVDLAIRRRFAFQRVFPSAEVVRDCAGPRCRGAFESLLDLFLMNANDDVFDLMPGHGYFLAEDDVAGPVLRTGVAPLLRDYIRNGYLPGFEDEIQAYLDSLEVGT